MYVYVCELDLDFDQRKIIYIVEIVHHSVNVDQYKDIAQIYG